MPDKPRPDGGPQEASFADQYRKLYDKARELFREEDWKDFTLDQEWIPFEVILADLDESERRLADAPDRP